MGNLSFMLSPMIRLLASILCISTTLCTAQTTTTPAFDEAKALAFLDRYEGRWVGSYQLRNMMGQVLQSLEAEVIYQWETNDEGTVLKGRAVYGTEQGMAIAESETFIANRQLFSIITENNKQRTYRGVLDKNGKTIAWAPIDKDNPLDESFRETFGRDAEGKETLSSQAYENVVRNDIEVLLTMHGQLTRAPLE